MCIQISRHALGERQTKHNWHIPSLWHGLCTKIRLDNLVALLDSLCLFGICGEQVLVTGSIHLVGDVLKLLRR